LKDLHTDSCGCSRILSISGTDTQVPGFCFGETEVKTKKPPGGTGGFFE